MVWTFITAGVGSQDFEEAADRLAQTIDSFQLFDKIQVFKSSDVELYAPEIVSWYSKEELAGLKGYGWYIWKSRFAKVVVEDDFENSDGIMYLDAGCEAYLSVFSKKRLKKYMKIAERSGSCLFRIPTPERLYTKQLLLDRFSTVAKNLDEFQFQSGSWLFTGKVAKEFLKNWDEVVWEDKRFTDESISPSGEIEGFVCNRYDQAVFSMVARSLSLSACGDVPPGDLSGFKPRARLFFYPFAWARNRQGVSLVSKRMKLIGEISLIPVVFREKSIKILQSLLKVK
jgi:hypothetical protein